MTPSNVEYKVPEGYVPFYSLPEDEQALVREQTMKEINMLPREWTEKFASRLFVDREGFLKKYRDDVVKG